MAIATFFILYYFLRESTAANIIYAIVISLGVTCLIKYTFELNGDIEEERMFLTPLSK